MKHCLTLSIILNVLHYVFQMCFLKCCCAIAEDQYLLFKDLWMYVCLLMTTCIEQNITYFLELTKLNLISIAFVYVTLI